MGKGEHDGLTEEEVADVFVDHSKDFFSFRGQHERSTCYVLLHTAY